MHKKTLFFIISCTILSSFQTQTTQERNTALGIGLFAGTIFLTKYQQRQVQPDEAAIDAQRMFRGHQARKQAAALKEINLTTKQADAAVKITKSLRKNKFLQSNKQQAEQNEMDAEEKSTRMFRGHQTRQQAAVHEEEQRKAAITSFNLAQPQAAMIEDEDNTENDLAHQLSASGASASSSKHIEQPAVTLLAIPVTASSSAQIEQLSSTTIAYTAIKKNSVSFPDFSDPIFAQLKQNPHLGYNRKSKTLTFLDSALDLSEEKITERASTESLNRIIQQDTFKPNNNHDYWQKKEIQSPVKTISIFYVPGSYNARIHGSHQQATLENQQEMTLFAQKVALAENAIVKVIYFQWDGQINEQKRYEAGQTLAQAITDNAADQIFTVSHSHGGNVVLHAAQALKTSKKSIDHAIIFGCPSEDSNVNIHENNIKKILNIYGDADFTGAAGSFLQSANARSIVQPNTLTTTTSLRKEAKNIVNITLKTHGDDMRHKETVPKGLDNLPEIIQCLNTQYKGIQDLIVNASNQELLACLDDTCHHPHVTHEMEDLSKKNAVSFETSYQQSIFAKKSMSQKFDEEVAPHLHPNLATIAKAAVNVAEQLIHDPINTIISQELDRIQKNLNLSEQTILLHQISQTLYTQYPDTNIETIQLKLQRHKKYNQLKRNLERQQFFSQCIIGTTRNYDSISEETADKDTIQWLTDLKPQLDAAQKIYEQLNDEVTLGFLSGYDKLELHTQQSFMQDALSGYNELDAQTQQALLSALKPDLEKKVKDHLGASSPKQHGYVSGIISTAKDYLPSWLSFPSPTNSSSSGSLTSSDSQKIIATNNSIAHVFEESDINEEF